MVLELFALSLLFSIVLCVHVVRTGREMYWLMIILMFQPLGGVVYAIVNVLPDLLGGSAARRITRVARETMDPTREYREAKEACEDTPTVKNQSRLAAAATALGRHEESERLYAEAAHGIHAEDPSLLLGRANALIELGRFTDALAVLEVLSRDEAEGRTPAAALALGRANEGAGRIGEADTAYKWASEHVPGFEGLARYAAFMARHGRPEEAREVVVELDKRLAKLNPTFRKEARHWRDLAAKALSEG